MDHPAAAVDYSPVSGSLFGPNGPSYLDVHQGAEGDCWLMSSLAEVAVRDPSDIENMFTDLGSYTENGSQVELYKVRFFNPSGVAEYVTVDTELPDGGGYYDRVENGVLWVALAEKAYAEANGEGMVTTSNQNTDSYDALDGGQPYWALQAITGKPASSFNINPNNMAAAWNSGELIVLGSSPNAGDNLVVGDSEGTHAYAVISYDASSSSFELYNPWGLSSVVGHTTTYNGNQVYDGPFWLDSTVIAQGLRYPGFRDWVDSWTEAQQQQLARRPGKCQFGNGRIHQLPLVGESCQDFQADFGRNSSCREQPEACFPGAPNRVRRSTTD